MIKLITVFFLLLFAVGIFTSFLVPKSPKQAVEDIFTQTSQNCSPNSQRTKYIICYKKNLEPGVRKYGLSVFMDELNRRYTQSVNFDNGGINQCHDIAHAIGQTAGAYSRDLNKTILECPNLCTSGCFHGVVEGAISTGYDILKNIHTLCIVKDNDALVPGNSDCYHGLGHGVADLSGFDLIQSIKYCDMIESPEGQRNCGSGVIMELFEPSSFDHALMQYPDDVSDLCSTLWGTYRDTCYITAGTHIFTKNTNEKEAIKACTSVPEDLRSNCIVSLGQNMFFVHQGDSQKLFSFCALVPEQFYDDCFNGVIESGVMSDPLVRKGVEICQDFDKVNSAKCFDSIVSKMKLTSRLDNLPKICDTVKNDRKEICISAITK